MTQGSVKRKLAKIKKLASSLQQNASTFTEEVMFNNIVYATQYAEDTMNDPKLRKKIRYGWSVFN